MTVSNKLSEIINSFIIVTLFTMISPTIIQITQLTILNKLMIPFLLILCIIYYFFTKKIVVNVSGAFLLVFFMLILLFSVEFSRSMSAVSDIKTLIVYYLPIIIMILFIFLRHSDERKKRDSILSIVLLFGLLEAILGIIQFMLKNPIFPTMVDGQQVVSSIYYVPGSGGTGDLSVVGGSYLVRASGTMGSGLGLGILSICSLGILELRQSTKLTFMMKVVLLISILLTLTGAIYIGYLSFIIFKHLLNKSTRLIMGIYYCLWVAGIATPLIFAHIPQKIIEHYPTIGSRFNGIKYYQSVLDSDLVSQLFGQNFTNTWQNLANTTININNRYVVDNFYMYSIFNIGILGIAILFFSYRNIMLQQLKNDSKSPLIALQMCLLVIGFANNVSTTFGIIGIIALLSVGNDKKDVVEVKIRE